MKTMTIISIVCFTLTLLCISGVYNVCILRWLMREYNIDNEDLCFSEFVIKYADFTYFKILRFSHLDWLLNSKKYRKIIILTNIIKVSLSIAGFVALFILSSNDEFGFLSIKL